MPGCAPGIRRPTYPGLRSAAYELLARSRSTGTPRRPGARFSRSKHRISRAERGAMSSNAASHEGPGPPETAGADLGPLPGFMRPLVDRVARVQATVHMKLLAGFLLIALLLLSMGVLSVAVLARTNDQV